MEENQLEKYLPKLREYDLQLIKMVVNSLDSKNSRRAYQRHLEEFFLWHLEQGRPRLSKAVVNDYKSYLRDLNLSAANINQKLSAIRKLASEAEENESLETKVAIGIKAIKGVPGKKDRKGNWLTKKEANIWINAPDKTSLIGLRDRALLSVMLGSGLRRSETSTLTFAHIQERADRWLIIDIKGKREKYRDVPIADWVKKAIDDWAAEARISDGFIFRKIHKTKKPLEKNITPSGIYKIIKEYGAKLNKEDIAPHDLRRTFAKLSYDGGSKLDQVQFSLGHNSIQTTENYLGLMQELVETPSDSLGLTLED